MAKKKNGALVFAGYLSKVFLVLRARLPSFHCTPVGHLPRHSTGGVDAGCCVPVEQASLGEKEDQVQQHEQRGGLDVWCALTGKKLSSQQTGPEDQCNQAAEDFGIEVRQILHGMPGEMPYSEVARRHPLFATGGAIRPGEVSRAIQVRVNCAAHSARLLASLFAPAPE